MKSIKDVLSGNSYPGRGIIAGMTQSGRACIGYFIGGRSENSRNRVFEKDENGDIFTRAFDESKVSDPSLIIYRAVAHTDKLLIATNGDQTDTIAEFMENGKCPKMALRTREFEPDSPNFTPRISCVVRFDEFFRYEMSILKCGDGKGTSCDRYFFEYQPQGGAGHLIHTYEGDGNPLPSFTGEPRKIKIEDDIDLMTKQIWDALDTENRVSLYVEYTDLKDMKREFRIVNKNAR